MVAPLKTARSDSASDPSAESEWRVKMSNRSISEATLSAVASFGYGIMRFQFCFVDTGLLTMLMILKTFSSGVSSAHCSW